MAGLAMFNVPVNDPVGPVAVSPTVRVNAEIDTPSPNEMELNEPLIDQTFALVKLPLTTTVDDPNVSVPPTVTDTPVVFEAMVMVGLDRVTPDGRDKVVSDVAVSVQDFGPR